MVAEKPFALPHPSSQRTLESGSILLHTFMADGAEDQDGSRVRRDDDKEYGRYGCTTVIVDGEALPTPRMSGRYMSSTNDGGTVYVPGVTARTR